MTKLSIIARQWKALRHFAYVTAIISPVMIGHLISQGVLSSPDWWFILLPVGFLALVLILVEAARRLFNTMLGGPGCAWWWQK